MSRIKYICKSGVEPCLKHPIIVKLDGRLCGEIRKVDGGFQYFPNRSKNGGTVFESVYKVKKSLLDDWNDE